MDLELQLDERPDGHLAGRLIFDSDLFDRETVVRLASHVGRVIEAVSGDPSLPISEISLLTTAERDRQLVTWNATTVEREPAPAICDLVALQAQRDPAAAAITDGDETIDRAELQRRSADIAARLGAAGIGAGDAVAVDGDLSAWLVASLLGTSRSGAVPLGPELRGVDGDRPASVRAPLSAASRDGGRDHHHCAAAADGRPAPAGCRAGRGRAAAAQRWSGPRAGRRARAVGQRHRPRAAPGRWDWRLTGRPVGVVVCRRPDRARRPGRGAHRGRR